jgi:diguanylate cyclase (GGDEF)-like protein/PAS domain S-box-containing protein
MEADYKRLTRAELERVLTTLRTPPAEATESEQVLHDLQVHRIELEMQNRALREAQRDLEAARNRYADLYDFAPVGYLTLSPRGSVVEINLTGATMLGMERSRVLGLPFIAWLAPGESRRFMLHLRDVAQSNEPQTVELRLHCNGKLLHVRLESASRRLDGETLCRTAIIDITEHKQAEHELRRAHDQLESNVRERTIELQRANEALEAKVAERQRAEQELRLAATVFESTDQAIVIMDSEGKIVAVNQSFTRSTGYSQAETVGKDVRSLHSKQHDEVFWCELWNTLRHAGTWQGEVRQQRKDGELLSVWQTIGTVKDDQGEVVNHVAVVTDISTLKLAQARLDHLAHHDALTNLPNRLLLETSLNHAIEVARRHRRKVAVLFFDLDEFKSVNDTLGHRFGDRMLKTVAERLRQTVRAEDTVARFGGDEFVLVLEEVDQPEDAIILAERVLAAVRCPIQLEETNVEASASIGISLFPDDAESSAELLKAADMAMYSAKNRGGGMYRFHETERHARFEGDHRG